MEKGVMGTSSSSLSSRTDPGSKTGAVVPSTLQTREFAPTFSRGQNAKPRLRPEQEKTSHQILPRDLHSMQPDPHYLINTLSPPSPSSCWLRK